MKTKLIIGLLAIALLPTIASADTLTLEGAVRTPSGEIEQISEIHVFDNGEELEASYEIDYENGSFLIENIPAPTENSERKTIWIQGHCILHTYNIYFKEGHYVLTDAHSSNDMELHRSTNLHIDLGTLIEQKSNRVKTLSDDGVTSLVTHNETWIAENGAYRKKGGHFGNLESNTQYQIELTSESGNTWTEEFTTGDYCSTTRIIKNRNYVEIENFEKNADTRIGFFKRIVLFFKGLFS